MAYYTVKKTYASREGMLSTSYFLHTCNGSRVMTNSLQHDNKASGHFGYSKTLSRFVHYHWKNKSTDIYEYCRRCSSSQQNKDGSTKPLDEPQPLELPNRRWGFVSMDFIAHLPETDSDYACITTFVDRFSERVRLVTSRSTDTATDVAECFFRHVFRLHELPDSIVSAPIVIRSSRPNSGRTSWTVAGL